MRRTVLLPLILLVAGCGAGCVAGHVARPVGSAVITTVRPGEPVRLTDPDRSLTVSAPPDALPPGTLRITAPERGTAVPAEVHQAAEVTVGAVTVLAAPMRLEFSVPADASPEATIGYFDVGLRRWVPIVSTRTGTVLAAETDHLTDFGWWDNLAWHTSQFLGTRAQEPVCANQRPAWLRDLITVRTAQAQLFACAQSAGSNLEVKVVNNRAYPVTLELSERPASVHIDASWPSSLMDLVQKIVALADSGGRFVVLPALGSATLTFAAPQRPDLVTGYVRLDTMNAIFYTVLEAFTDRIDISVTLPGGLQVDKAAFNCVLSLAAAGHDLAGRLRHLDVGVITTAVQQVSGCMETAVENELSTWRTNPEFLRLARAKQDAIYGRLAKAKQAFAVYKIAKNAHIAADLAFDNVQRDIRDGVDLTLDLDPGPLLIDADHVGPFTLGMTVDQVRVAAGTILDRDEYCGFYTFHGERSFGDGDGPTFFFDDAGHLRGMLMGGSVFHRSVRTERGARIGTTLADLTKAYGSGLIPPGHADSPDLAWVKGSNGHTLAFEMDGQQRVRGFRVGLETFATALEFCG